MNENLFKSNTDTVEHINQVRHYLWNMIQELDQRGRKHDASKLQSPEQEIFASTYGKLDQTVYGTPEYQKLLDDVKPALDHHYANNRHHPQHWPNGVNDMTLIDLVEMLCDWKASTMRVKDGNIRKSIEHNATRFEMSPQLAQIFHNTVREMFPEWAPIPTKPIKCIF